MDSSRVSSRTFRYKLDHIEPPTQERVDNARRILRTDEYKGYLNA